MPVCEPCYNRLKPQSARLCVCCGEDLGIREFSTSNRRIDEDVLPEFCRPCEVVPPDFEKAVAFGTYEGTLRGLIHLLKYQRMEPVAQRLGALVAGSLPGLLKDGVETMVIPVPLHRSKREDRGFNQATLIARAIIRAVRRKGPSGRLKLAEGLLERRKATESQAGLTTHQRRRNLSGAFFVSAAAAQKLAGREVLLIDDIYTTGATARACSKALRKAGASRVVVATVARAQREGTVKWDSTMDLTVSPNPEGKAAAAWLSSRFNP